MSSRNGVVWALAVPVLLVLAACTAATEPQPDDTAPAASPEREQAEVTVPDLPLLELMPTEEEIVERLGAGSAYRERPRESGQGILGAPAGYPADPGFFGPECAASLDSAYTEEVDQGALALVDSPAGQSSIGLVRTTDPQVAANFVSRLREAITVCSDAAASNPSIPFASAETAIDGALAFGLGGGRAVYVAVDDHLIAALSESGGPAAVDALVQLQLDVFTFRTGE